MISSEKNQSTFALGRMANSAILISRQEEAGFEEPAVIAEEGAYFRRLFREEFDGGFAPEFGDALAVMRIALPDEGVGAEDGGE